MKRIVTIFVFEIYGLQLEMLLKALTGSLVEREYEYEHVAQFNTPREFREVEFCLLGVLAKKLLFVRR